MRNIFSIAEYTVKENIRSKIFYILLLFLFVMLGTALIFSSLSPDTEARVITDIGLASIEIFTFMAGIFIAVNLVLTEIENRTIYMLMSRPLHRAEYILGRYMGTIAILFITILIMAFFLALLLIGVTKSSLSHIVLWSLITTFFKIFIVVSIALTSSLVFSSSITAVAFSSLVWIIGHFSQELKILSQQASFPAAKKLLTGLYYLMPNFQYLNLKDKLYIPEAVPMNIIFLVLLYSIVYTTLVLMVGIALFKRKEF